MIAIGQINAVNARADSFGTPLVVMTHLGGSEYRFERIANLDRSTALVSMAAFTFDTAGSCTMHWDGPSMLTADQLPLFDWWCEMARKVAGIFDPTKAYQTALETIRA